MSMHNASSPTTLSVREIIFDVVADSVSASIGLNLNPTVLISSIIPTLVGLHWFTTATSRKEVVIIINAIFVPAVVGFGVWSNLAEVRRLVSVLSVTRFFNLFIAQLWGRLRPVELMNLSTFSTLALVFQLVPWFVDLVLACRLMVHLPPKASPVTSLFSLFVFPVAVKSVLRLVAVWAFCAEFGLEIESLRGPTLQAAFAWSRIQWVLDMFDNA